MRSTPPARKSSAFSVSLDDDRTVVEWDDSAETPVELDTDDLRELEADAVTPPVASSTLPGYDLGRRDERMEFFAKWDGMLKAQELRGISRAFHAVREHMIEDGASPAIADAIMTALADRVGVKLF